MQRYAIYFVPRHHTTLAAFGRSWFAFDPEPDHADPLLDQLEPELALPEPLDRAALTETPRRYGLHLTLKAPFSLADDASVEDLQQTARLFAMTHPVAFMPQFRLGTCADCLALMPQTNPTDALDLAGACVEAFTPFRRPTTPDELEVRRKKDRLTPKQDGLLLRWGFPFVFDEARIALTLTVPLDETRRERVSAALEHLVAPLCRAPLPIEDICILMQADSGSEFRVINRFPLSFARQ